MPSLGNHNLTAAQIVEAPKAIIMGIVNVTPDSFSGDGVLNQPGTAAVAQALRMAGEGADIIDIGGESTRPGHTPVTAAEEISRVVPVIAALRATSAIPIAIDTTKAAVAAAALDAGATIINDVQALRGDAAMGALAARRGAPIILMHNRSAAHAVTQTAALGAAYTAPHYDNFIDEILHDLRGHIDAALAAGIKPEQIILDPGIGFGKSVAQNLALIRHCDVIAALGYPVMLGVSRKSFLGLALNLPVTERVEAGLAASIIGWQRGAKIFRTHDVAATRRALDLAQAVVSS